MEYFLTIKDTDIFPDSAVEMKEYVVRPTSKGIVIDGDGGIALLTARGHGLFPGGGIEMGETKEEAFIRECNEEIGCNVMITSYLGQFDQYRAQDKKKYEVHFFVAHVIGEKGRPTTTQAGELACVLTWETKEAIGEILVQQLHTIPLDEYPSQFNCRTHLGVWRKFLEEKNEK